MTCFIYCHFYARHAYHDMNELNEIYYSFLCIYTLHYVVCILFYFIESTINMYNKIKIQCIHNTVHIIIKGGGGCIRGSWILEFRFLGCQILDL